MNHAVGIDFGTTYSRVAVISPEGECRILADPHDRQNRILFPSVVALRENNSIELGWEAVDFRSQHPERVISSVKKWLGQIPKDRLSEPTFLPSPWKIRTDGKAEVEAGNKKISAEEIAAFILKALKDQAEQFLQENTEQAVISVPAHFDISQRQALEEAGHLAGFSEVRLLEDARAAEMIHQQQEQKFEGEILVYHFGGGFFRAAVLEIKKNKEEILACRGNSHISSEKMDLKLAELFWREITDQYTGAEVEQDLPLRQIVLDEAERAKHAVSHRGSYDVHIVREKYGLRYQRAVSRFEVVEQIRGMVESTLSVCEETLKDAGMKTSQIKRVLLVGGATRIPLIKETVQKLFKAEIIRNMNSDEVMAWGTAKKASDEFRHQR
ncbi:MAG: Hsp70 family protein [Candidatus Omnitrophica bacterium]|nr:Hsp70 family protein [Candidatus Omnitrophota bacterium]